MAVFHYIAMSHDGRRLAGEVEAKDRSDAFRKLDRQRLSFVERALTLALRAPEGDFRDWNDIRAWARQIAAALEVPSARGGNLA